MGARADNDLWGQAFAFECQYGDRANGIIEEKIAQLTEEGETAEAAFWMEVSERLTQLHAIRYPGSACPTLSAHMMKRNSRRPSPRT